jgi:hypothetical protein
LAAIEADTLVAAAYVHDGGYAPELRDTGFIRRTLLDSRGTCGHERLAGLVAPLLGEDRGERTRPQGRVGRVR